MNAHNKMLRAITAAVVVVAAVTSRITHTMLASDIRRGINERSRHLDWEEHCEDLEERSPDCFMHQYRMPQQTFNKLADIILRPLLDLNCSFVTAVSPRTLLDEMTGCIHRQCCTERESVFYRQFRTPRSPIAQSDIVINSMSVSLKDYEFCVCEIYCFLL